MSYSDLRSFLAELDEDLLRVKQALDPKFEIAAFLRASQFGGQAVLCENIIGFPGASVSGNLLTSRRIVARALGCTEKNLAETYMARKDQCIPPIAARGHAPVQEIVHNESIDLLATLPIMTHHEQDAAPFITSGVVFARDPKTGRRAMGIHRMMVQGKNQLGIFLANPPLSEYLRNAEEAEKPLEIAVALGLDPATLLAAVVRTGSIGNDKLEIAGALRGAPLELVKATSVELEVPATAEIIIEGRMIPHTREQEGPFGENTGYYFSNKSPVVEVSAITHRSDFIYPGLCPWTLDVDNLLSLAAGTELLWQLRNHIYGVTDLELVTGTCGFSAVIAVKATTRTVIRRLIQLALSLDQRLKSVTVVDQDVNIRDPREVSWAMATRYQPVTDTVIIDGVEGYVIDPSSSPDGSGSKIGFDATRGPGDEFNKITVPKKAMQKAREILAQLQSRSSELK